MITVGIVTFHFVNNFGGILQSYAIWRTVNDKCKADPFMIDYKNWFIRLTDFLRLFPITMDWEEMKTGWKTMPYRFARVRKFRRFISGRYRLSRRYGSGMMLRLRKPHYDVYLCGSDQIWNPYLTFGLADPYFLGFAEKESRKFSYAPSFGTSRLSKYHAKKIKNYLMDFSDISVREKTGLRLVKEFTGKPAVQLIDPVFLLSSEEWGSIASAPCRIKASYLLLYIMQRDEGAYKTAKELKEQLGMPLVEISRYGYQPDFVDISLVDVGPEEFLWLFQNAGYICTNSYHGLAFSLIFEKDFYLIPCRRFYSRISSLLELLHICMPEKQEGMQVVYDKESVRNIIAQQKKESVCYLKKNIAGNGV